MCEKTPKAGEWWFSQDMSDRVYIHGISQKGRLICESASGNIYDWAGIETYYHEPACDSWQWQPEKWPKFISNRFGFRDGIAFIRWDSEADVIAVSECGKETRLKSYTKQDIEAFLRQCHWDLITESEALARIVKPVEVVADNPAIDPALKALRDIAALHGIDTEGMQPQEIADAIIAMNEGTSVSIAYTYLSPDTKKLMGEVDPPQPAEDPDEWVTQDREPERPGLDEWRCVYEDGKSSPWFQSVINEPVYRKHGDIVRGAIFELRCRRRDLPPLPEPKPATRTVTFYEWACWGDHGYEVIEWRAFEPKQWPNRHRTEAPPRTIEVPV